MENYYPSRYYYPDKWHKLSQLTRKKIFRNPKRISDKKKRDFSCDQRKTMSTNTAVDNQSERDKSINVDVKVLHHMYQLRNLSGVA